MLLIFFKFGCVYKIWASSVRNAPFLECIVPAQSVTIASRLVLAPRFYTITLPQSMLTCRLPTFFHYKLSRDHSIHSIPEAIVFLPHPPQSKKKPVTPFTCSVPLHQAVAFSNHRLGQLLNSSCNTRSTSIVALGLQPTTIFKNAILLVEYPSPWCHGRSDEALK